MAMLVSTSTSGPLVKPEKEHYLQPEKEPFLQPQKEPVVPKEKVPIVPQETKVPELHHHTERILGLIGIDLSKARRWDEFVEERKIYYEEIKHHKGYLITSPFGEKIPNGVIGVNLAEYSTTCDSTLCQIAEFAVSEYNSLLPAEDAWKKLCFVELLMVNYQHVLGGVLHYITILASDSSGETETFHARVKLCNGGCMILLDFRLFSDQSGPPALGVFIPRSVPKDYAAKEALEALAKDKGAMEAIKLKEARWRSGCLYDENEYNAIHSLKDCVHRLTCEVPKFQPGSLPYVTVYDPPPLI